MINDRGAHLLTLKRLFECAFRRYGTQTAIRYGGRDLTYAELDERSARLANGFRALGLESGSQVGILMENRPEFILAHIGALRAGVTVVPLNCELNDRQVRSLLERSDIDVLTIDEAFFDVVRVIQREQGELRHVIAHAEDGTIPIGFHDLSELLYRADSSPPDIEIAPTDTAALYHTSGTTGNPKQVVHSHRALTLNCYAHVHELDIRQDERMLLMTPLSHSAEPFARAGLAQGATVVLRQGFESAEVLTALEREEITWTYLIPTMIGKLLDDETLSGVDTGALATVAYGAAPIPEPVLRDGIAEFGEVFVQFYGLTEVPNLISVLPKSEHDPDDSALASAGYPTQLVEVTLLDIAADWADDVGEIAVRSPYTLVEYAGDRRAYTEDGWLKTDDLGRIEDGRLQVLDRIQDVIVVDGEPVFSASVESAIQHHPRVKQVAVIGVPGNDTDRTADQRVKAVVVPAEDATVEAEELREFCRDRLDDGLPESVDIVGRLPETPYGKIDKQALRDPYW